jgi:hypothetical protein
MQGAALLDNISYFLRREEKSIVLLLSSARRKKQRSIHPNQAFPYMGRM